MSNTDTEITLSALIFCQPLARAFSGQLLSEITELPDLISAGREVTSHELSLQFVSPHLRPGDVPLAFHANAFDEGAALARTYPTVAEPTQRYGSAASIGQMSTRLKAYGRMLQYQFSDGLILDASQILYHARSKVVPRHLLPLAINVTAEVTERGLFQLESDQPTHSIRPSWQVLSEKVVMNILLAAQRLIRQHSMNEHESRGPKAIFFSFDDRATQERRALKINKIEFNSESWGPWRITTSLPSHGSVFYGRARLELEPPDPTQPKAIGRFFSLDTTEAVLGFHTFHDQLSRLSLHRPQRKQASSDDSAPTPVVNEEAELEQHATPSLHLVGHSAIQAAIEDISEMLAKDGRTLIVQPKSETVALADIKPRLLLSGDGSVRMITRFKTDDESWEAHGIPHSSSYILLALQLGLGATTGYANTSLAHSRRGVKRDRDIKVLRHLGYASMIFCDAANFALGRPLTDGTVVESEEAVCESIFNRIGNLITKSEGWPNGTGHLSELCSSNVTTLISGFVAQVVRDIRGTPNASNASEASEASEVFEGRTISVYLPRGEFRLPGLARAVALFFHAIVADLAEHTSGTCFTRARTKYFDDFMNGRTTAERDDLVIRREVSQEVASQMIYQPGINERYLLPESSRPPRGTQIFLLLEQGFELFIDQKQIEEFEAKDFRPEFTLHEDQGDAPAIDAIALGPQKINWFELSPKFFFKGVEITGDQALRLSKDGMIEFQGRLYRIKANELPSLKRLTQFWAKIQANAPSPLRAKRRRTEDTYYQLPRSQTLELLALRASGVKVRGGDRWQEITDFYDSLGSEREALEISSTFKTELQPYQKVGVQWLNDLNKLGLGGILADDMGLGKTVTTLAFLENQRVKGTMGATLVLVPTSLTYNWLAESERFAPQIPTLIFHSRMPESMLDFIQSNQQCLVICTYGLLQENSELFQQVEWNIIAFDEAQNLKNITTKRTNAARKLRTSFRVCLTGTPLENHYGEFFSLFDLIVPGSLGELSDFREKYVNPVHVLREDIDDLKLKTKPLILRRTKSQVMTQLPEKIETTIRLPFEDEQKRIYRDIATAYNDQIRSQIAVHGESKLQLQMLTALLRLRQACSDPSAIPGVQYTGEPPKITTLAEALQQITESGASALVFTQFLATFERIRRTLSGLNILHFDISGADSRLQREKKLRAFQDQTQGAVMLMTLKTGGVGLNLTKANYVFHIEPWWNPAVENQATDRAHRIGQLETVQVYRYLIRESVEEKIEVLKDLKSKRFDALFSTSENDNELGPSGSALTQKDFEFLLS